MIEREQFDAVHRRMDALTHGFTRLPGDMTPEERAELDYLEREHDRLYRECMRLSGCGLDKPR